MHRHRYGLGMTPATVTRDPAERPGNASTRRPALTAVVRAPGTLTVLFDQAAPIALYYGLRSAGAGMVPSLVAGTAAPAVSGIVQAIRHRRTDALAVTVVILLVLSAGVSVIAGGPRFLLAKDAVLTAVWGTWFLLSLRGHRPLTFRFARPLLEAHRIFDPRTRTWSAPTERSWDELWELVPRFRRMWQDDGDLGSGIPGRRRSAGGDGLRASRQRRTRTGRRTVAGHLPAVADHHECLSQPLGPLAHLARPSADRLTRGLLFGRGLRAGNRARSTCPDPSRRGRSR